MKNKKGFTLVELIAVIVILSLLITIAVPTVITLMAKNRKKAYEGKIDVILKQAKQYARDNENFLYSSTSMYDRYICNVITIGELKNAGYLEELKEDGSKGIIKDPRNNESMESQKVVVYINSSQYATDDDLYKGNLVATIKDVSKCSTSYAGFGYKGREEVFTAPSAGTYKIEAWGGEGGSSSTAGYIGGYGAYAYGEITLSAGEKLYINVAGAGEQTMQLNQTIRGGYNGGGSSVANCGTNDNKIGSGGGASSVALKSGLLSTLSNDIDKIVIVAAGGGGANYCTGSSNGVGGSGGGISGVNGTGVTDWSRDRYGLGGTQTTPGCRANNIYCTLFGKSNESNILSPFTGGGGGFYGGGPGERSGGGGGSSYIGNSRLTNKGMYCYNCTESTDASTKTTSTTCHHKNPEVNCAKQSSGYVRISKVS